MRGVPILLLIGGRALLAKLRGWMEVHWCWRMGTMRGRYGTAIFERHSFDRDAILAFINSSHINYCMNFQRWSKSYHCKREEVQGRSHHQRQRLHPSFCLRKNHWRWCHHVGNSIMIIAIQGQVHYIHWRCLQGWWRTQCCWRHCHTPGGVVNGCKTHAWGSG